MNRTDTALDGSKVIHRETDRLYFPPHQVPFIDWNKIEARRFEVSADMIVHTHADGGITVIIGFDDRV